MLWFSLPDVDWYAHLLFKESYVCVSGSGNWGRSLGREGLKEGIAGGLELSQQQVYWKSEKKYNYWSS